MRYLTTLFAVLVLSFSSLAASPTTNTDIDFIGNVPDSRAKMYRVVDGPTKTVCILVNVNAGYGPSVAISCRKKDY